ncbi:MAG: cobalamin-dependent protein, partial [Myxococcales bacterium]|nr:cobalamin-dependent protein [Myxococcales bacterium]
AATAFDVPALEAALQVALLMGPAVEVFEGVLAPALVAMGHQWATGISGVGEEHLATQAIFTAARELVRLVQPGPHSPRLLLACVDGETHEVPIYGVALHAARRGWSATLLGARTPPPALEAALHHMAPAAVGLSVTVSVQDVDPEALFARYGAACGRTPWIVGGASAERYREAIEAAGGRVGLAGEDLSEFLSRARPRAR